MKIKNKPLKDGSGKGLRLNEGRGGCEITKEKGQGKDYSESKLKGKFVK